MPFRYTWLKCLIEKSSSEGFRDEGSLLFWRRSPTTTIYTNGARASASVLAPFEHTIFANMLHEKKKILKYGADRFRKYLHRFAHTSTKSPCVEIPTASVHFVIFINTSMLFSHLCANASVICERDECKWNAFDLIFNLENGFEWQKISMKFSGMHAISAI